LTKLDDKYDDLIDIAEKIKSVDASTINEQYLPTIKSYVNSNKAKNRGDRGEMGFGTDNVLSKTVTIPDNVFFVKNNRNIGDGKSWQNAFNNLQEAIDNAYDNGGGEVWIAAGNYTPTHDSNRNV